MRDHSWDVRMYICTSVSVMLGMSICAHAQGLRHQRHYTRMSMEDRVGERGERQEKKRLVSSTKKSMSQVIQDSLFNHVYGVFVLDIHIL